MTTFALHGNLGTTVDWQRYDFFHGKSEALDLWAEADRGLGLEAWAQNFCTRVRDEQVGDAKPWLAGYSLGGRLAMHAIVEAPEMWSGAVIISAHPGLADEAERELRRQRDVEWAEKARGESWLDFLDEWNAQPVLDGEPEADFLEQQRHLAGRSECVARGFELWSLGSQRDLSDRLAACLFPVLWLTGSRDTTFTDLGAEMSDLLPNSEHRVLDGCGHRILQEAPQLAADAIRDFQTRNL